VVHSSGSLCRVSLTCRREFKTRASGERSQAWTYGFTTASVFDAIRVDVDQRQLAKEASLQSPSTYKVLFMATQKLLTMGFNLAVSI
jgi:hypothetical protein